ncbi:hypothetical protein J1605_013952 [Eschrichtius robustus]|uniref:Uncharacterized protein n=1 Tax=Eschrichtius robustus TaxID=9764 RepID=A0AB34GFM0_ESCRO|nr:hypothetical protein J1605_013952 [Eschrichtius robustus]
MAGLDPAPSVAVPLYLPSLIPPHTGVLPSGDLRGVRVSSLCWALRAERTATSGAVCRDSQLMDGDPKAPGGYAWARYPGLSHLLPASPSTHSFNWRRHPSISEGTPHCEPVPAGTSAVACPLTSTKPLPSCQVCFRHTDHTTRLMVASGMKSTFPDGCSSRPSAVPELLNPRPDLARPETQAGPTSPGPTHTAFPATWALPGDHLALHGYPQSLCFVRLPSAERRAGDAAPLPHLSSSRRGSSSKVPRLQALQAHGNLLRGSSQTREDFTRQKTRSSHVVEENTSRGKRSSSGQMPSEMCKDSVFSGNSRGTNSWLS